MTHRVVRTPSLAGNLIATLPDLAGTRNLSVFALSGEAEGGVLFRGLHDPSAEYGDVEAPAAPPLHHRQRPGPFPSDLDRPIGPWLDPAGSPRRKRHSATPAYPVM